MSWPVTMPVCHWVGLGVGKDCNMSRRMGGY